jgi:hypothetical protein
MSDKISVKDAQAEINGLLVAEICRDFGINFLDVYPEHIRARGVGPEQAFIGLAIKRGHLALPAVQPRVKPLVWQALQIDRGDGHSKPNGDYEAHCALGTYYIKMCFGLDSYYWSVEISFRQIVRSFDTPEAAKAAAQAHYDARILSALDNNNREEVMPLDAGTNESQTQALDIGPGDQAVAGAAQIKVAWPEDARSLLAEADARIAWESLGFGADFAERVEAALDADPPEEIGILQARVEDQDRKIADLTRQLQGQPRRQSDANADTWQPLTNRTYEPVAGAAPVSVGPTLPRCECGMTGPCAWAECRSPNLAQKGGE